METTKKQEYEAPKILGVIEYPQERGFCLSMAEENRLFDVNCEDESNTASSYEETGWSWDW